MDLKDFKESLDRITPPEDLGRALQALWYQAKGEWDTGLMKQAIEHNGFVLISVFSPCVTFNHDNDFPFFKPRVRRLEDEDHDTSDWKTACEKAMLWGDTIYTGLFLQKKDVPSLGQQEPFLDEGGPLSRRPLGLSPEQVRNIVSRMM